MDVTKIDKKYGVQDTKNIVDKSLMCVILKKKRLAMKKNPDNSIKIPKNMDL